MITSDPHQFVWEEKYRPHKVADCILPAKLKETFQGFVDRGDVADLLLVGLPGTGKTTVARAMLEEIDCDYLFVPASLKGGIDTLRNEVQGFASSVSFKDKRKFVILDEADYLTYATQPALRNFMDLYKENCGFILTANYGNRIIPAIHSRCPPIEFHIPKSEIPVLATQFLKRLVEILDIEKIQFDKKVLAALITRYFPDWRRVINELQRYAVQRGLIDEGILVDLKAVSIKELSGFMKEKNFTAVRKWAAENIQTLDDNVFYREFYDKSNEFFSISYVPQLVVLLAKYEYQSNFVFSKEINFVAFCVECMIDAQWK